eukprot:TRINITY_DN1009_c0_g1_i1.p1 TRINITY_DN1009_c0_g1~~TRINITY_DN1009_c0_g1_i1.p1  ORF type:complete len:266 (+),score=84.44 TRINITY_DN1009_c0_g1_i1:70-867(+)
MSACELDEDRHKFVLLAKRMRDPHEGVTIKDRTFNFRFYRMCFVGEEAVDWFLREALAKDREEAVLLGKQLLEFDLIHHVADRHIFKDEYLYYRFREDDSVNDKVKYVGPSVASLQSSCGIGHSGWVLKKGLIFWNKRYMILKTDELQLYYYNTDLDSTPRAIIDLSEPSTILKEVEGVKKGYYSFQISNSTESFLFAVERSKEHDAWMDAFISAGVPLTEAPKDSEIEASTSIFDFSALDVRGNNVNLSDYRGKVCIILNVASK